MSDYKFINTTVVRRLDISRIILYLSIHILDTYLYIYILIFILILSLLLFKKF